MRAGDDRAFEALYERYHRRILVYVQGMVRDHGRAEDVTQEVFMSALRRLRATEQPIAFKPWIYEIAKNACIDVFRRSRRTQEVSFEAEEELGGPGGRLVSRAPTPDVAVDTRMSLDSLRGAFSGLSDVHHQILVMRELEGLSYREIGRRLHMSRPAVESTLFRARRRLAQEYEELVSGARCVRVQEIIDGSSAGRVGIRDRRAMARHLSHCQPCRRLAAIAGFDLAALGVHSGLPAKIAALLPLPAFLKRRWLGGGDAAPTPPSGPGAKVAQWSATVTTYGEQAVQSWGKAAAVVAAAAVVSAGAGVATNPSVVGLGGDGPSVGDPPPAQSPASSGRAGRGSAPGTTEASRAPTPAVAPGGAGAIGGTTAAGGGASGGGAGGGGAVGGGVAGATTGAAGGLSGAATDTVGGAAGRVGDASVPILGGGQTPRAGQVLDGAAKTVDRAAGAIQGATGAADATVGKVTDTVTGAVDQVTGPGAGAIDQAAGAAAGTVTGATGAATDAVGSATGTATDVAKQTTSAVGGLLGRR